MAAPLDVRCAGAAGAGGDGPLGRAGRAAAPSAPRWCTWRWCSTSTAISRGSSPRRHARSHHRGFQEEEGASPPSSCARTLMAGLGLDAGRRVRRQDRRAGPQGPEIRDGGRLCAGRAQSPAQVGETFTREPWRFEVMDLDGRRIDKVLVKRGCCVRARRVSPGCEVVDNMPFCAKSGMIMSTSPARRPRGEAACRGLRPAWLARPHRRAHGARIEDVGPDAAMVVISPA